MPLPRQVFVFTFCLTLTVAGLLVSFTGLAENQQFLDMPQVFPDKECTDGIDNDFDGTVDSKDPDCSRNEKNKECVSFNRNHCPKLLTQTGMSVKHMAVANLDQDIAPEIIVSNHSQIKVYKGTGQLYWTKTLPTKGFSHAAATYVADINGDGRHEIVAGNGHFLNALDSKGNILFTHQIIGTSEGYVIAQMDSSLALEIVYLSNMPNNGNRSTSFVVLDGATGKILFNEPFSTRTSHLMHSLATDMNGDGRHEVIAAITPPNSLGVLQNREQTQIAMISYEDKQKRFVKSFPFPYFKGGFKMIPVTSGPLDSAPGDEVVIQYNPQNASPNGNSLHTMPLLANDWMVLSKIRKIGSFKTAGAAQMPTEGVVQPMISPFNSDEISPNKAIDVVENFRRGVSFSSFRVVENIEGASLVNSSGTLSERENRMGGLNFIEPENWSAARQIGYGFLITGWINTDHGNQSFVEGWAGFVSSGPPSVFLDIRASFMTYVIADIDLDGILEMVIPVQDGRLMNDSLIYFDMPLTDNRAAFITYWANSYNGNPQNQNRALTCTNNVDCLSYADREGKCQNFTCQYVYKGSKFIRGDVNQDGEVDMSDAVYLLKWLFSNGSEPVCKDAADANDDGKITRQDVTVITEFLFASDPLWGMFIKEPFPLPGVDPTPDSLTCR